MSAPAIVATRVHYPAHGRLKTGYFALEWLNIYAVAYYSNYIFFFMREEFGLGNRGNLCLAALSGLIYIPGSLVAGKIAQQRGYFFALRVGFSVMAGALATGGFLTHVVSHWLVMVAWTCGMCFTWPALEALASENETRPGLARMIGIYNVVWASGAALSYFTGGALLDHLGSKGLFWLPAGVHLLQLVLVLWLERKARDSFHRQGLEPGSQLTPAELMPDCASPATAPPGVAKLFLRMAWLANPFAYIAMNTLIPLLPDLAARLELTTTLAGFVGSVWMFGRLFAFIALWCWPGWHYRLGWLVAAYTAMILSFALILLVPSLAVIVIAQLVFGLAVGLIYYSSLFYSMDVGETKGEHGGFHEALIGVGLFAGPAIGATTLQLAPNGAHAGVWAVSSVLVLGLAGLGSLGRKARGQSSMLSSGIEAVVPKPDDYS